MADGPALMALRRAAQGSQGFCLRIEAVLDVRVPQMVRVWPRLLDADRGGDASPLGLWAGVRADTRL
jgi:hypothetical protein